MNGSRVWGISLREEVNQNVLKWIESDAARARHITATMILIRGLAK